MKRRLVVGMLGLILAGCAHGRHGVRPVRVQPVPSLRDTINGDLSEDERRANVHNTAEIPALDQASRPRSPAGAGPIPELRDTINDGFPATDPGLLQAARNGLAPAPEATSNPTLTPPPPSNPAPAPAATKPAALPSPPELPPLPLNPAPSSSELPPLPLDLMPPPSGPPPVTGPRAELARPIPELAVTPPSATIEAAPAPAPSAAVLPPPTALRDPAFVQTRAEVPHPTELHSNVDSGKVLSLTVATVGEQKISLAELQESVKDWVRVNVPKGQIMNRDQVNELAGSVLEQLVDRATLIDEANRVLLKNDKQRKMFAEFIDKQWAEQETPKLLRRYNAKSELELRQQLQDQGRSLDLLRERYRKDTMAREFLHHQLQQRIARPELREMWDYYREHVRAFDRPAQITWRELTVKIDPQTDRATARQRTEELLNRLRRGEDFATLARASSQGPTAAKGGIWETEPGASSAPAVNEALTTLPLNQVSTVIEAPDGFHIVRVENRREAGPTPFVEVQDKIRDTLMDLNFQREIDNYTKRLRSRTLITYYIGEKPPAAAIRRDAQAYRTSAMP